MTNTSIVHHKRETCRACEGRNLRMFLSLGAMPLANSFLRSPDEFQDEATYPLDVYFCGNCSLIQLLDVIAPEVLFRNYIYVTGTAETIHTHYAEYAQTLVGLLNLQSSDLVVEVASNDGSLLKSFQRHDVRTLGIEPATNIAEKARANGVETVDEFFDSNFACELRGERGAAKVVIGNNVLAHTDDPGDFLRGCAELLDRDGLVAIEVPYLGEFHERLEYDTIYHEHLCYFSVTTLMRLCERVGLSIVRVDHVAVHGGSLRMYAARQDRQPHHAPEVAQMAERERSEKLTDYATWEAFAAKVEDNRQEIRLLLESLKLDGKQVAAYGAPAKGNTLLNYCRIDTQLVAYTVDKNPLKVGMFTPGMHLPVLNAATLIERQPDFVLILAWNFAGEIIRQQSEYQTRGGRFIIPVPEPKIV